MRAGNQLVGWALAGCLGIATAAGWLFGPHAHSADPLVLAVLWLNIAVMIPALGIEISRRPYSLHLIHLVAMFLFLGAASLLQYSSGILPVVGPIQEVRQQVLPAALATTLWLAGYLFAYELRSATVVQRRAGFLNRPITLGRALLLSAFALAGLVFLAALGLIGVTTRGAAEVALNDYSEAAGGSRFSSPLYALVYNLVRALPPFTLLATMLMLTRDPRTRSWGLLPIVAILGIGTLVVNNPFAAFRMFLVTNLIAFSAPFLLRRFETSWLAVLAIVAGLTVLPSLGENRFALDLKELSSSFRFMSPVRYLATSADVDSLGMTALVEKWIDHFGHRWGLQFLGTLLLFVPRTFWPHKPIGTGTMVTQGLGFDFTNLAPPITSEPLVNFGLVGVPVCGALFALILARLDAIYWSPGRKGIANTFRIIDTVYPFWLGCIVYLVRGDLNPAWGFTMSFSLWILPLGLGSLVFHGSPSAPRAEAAGAAR